MPARLIRDDMLDSERVQTLPIEARWLYVTVLLMADDAGLFESAAFKLGRRAGIDQNKVPSLLQLLLDSDLIRLYEIDGKRYGFIPRYGQRIQMRRLKHPLPPFSLAEGDADALRKFNDLAENSRCISVTHRKPPPEAEAEAEEEITGAKAPAALLAADDRKDAVFALGIPMLTSAGVVEKQARTFIGFLRKHNTDAEIIDALKRCAVERAVQPIPFLQGCLKTTKRHDNRQEAIEASNKAVGAKWAETMRGKA